jgi:hypothetical protein
MFNDQPIKVKLLHQFENLELDGNKSIYKFYRYEIFKLKIEGQRTDAKNGEIAFLAQSEINLEKCIIYCTMKSDIEINEIKYWRSVSMDLEICSYLVQDFILNYLTKKFKIHDNILP